MSTETTEYFCFGSLLTGLPCGKPAERVRAIRPDGMTSRIVYLCLDHRQQARAASWAIMSEPRSQNSSP